MLAFNASWSVCHKVLDPNDLFHEMCAYHGDFEIEAAWKLLWPSYSNKSYAARLEKCKRAAENPKNHLI